MTPGLAAADSRVAPRFTRGYPIIIFPTRGQKSAGNRIVLLSPRFWGMVKPKWRKHPAVLPIRFRMAEAGWPKVAEALGMPLGVHEATARAAAL